MSRVTVVTHDASGQLIKVCESHRAFKQWLKSTDWERHDLETWDAKVYEEI